MISGGKVTGIREAFRRIFSHPRTALELCVSSLCASILALASSIFVMQVLSRYVGYGVDATLATLCVGVLVAIVLEFIFRHIRMQVAKAVCKEPDETISKETFEKLVDSKLLPLEMLKPGMRQEVMRAPDTIAQAYSPTNLMSVLDVPFSALFIFVIFLFSPILALVSAFFCILAFLIGFYGTKGLQEPMKEGTQAGAKKNALLSSAGSIPETIRSFFAGEFLKQEWAKRLDNALGIQRRIEHLKALLQQSSQTLNAVMSVAVITVGAILVIRGEFDVGAMIGVNILASRALAPISKIAQQSETFAKAHRVQDLLDEFHKLNKENEKGGRLPNYTGRLEFKDLTFAYPNSTGPLFERTSFVLDAGQCLIVTGYNGAGKSTFAKLLLNLFEPTRGQIFADGVDIRQLEPKEWRQSLYYMPQEVDLFSSSLLENLTLGNEEIEQADIEKAIDVVGLKPFLNQTQEGLSAQVTDNGKNLSLGIKRRLGLARTLILSNGAKLAIFDEPTEGMDAEGMKAVYDLLGQYKKDGVTLIAMTHDPHIAQMSDIVMDLSSKPVPKLGKLQKEEAKNVG